MFTKEELLRQVAIAEVMDQGGWGYNEENGKLEQEMDVSYFGITPEGRIDGGSRGDFSIWRVRGVWDGVSVSATLTLESGDVKMDASDVFIEFRVPVTTAWELVNMLSKLADGAWEVLGFND